MAEDAGAGAHHGDTDIASPDVQIGAADARRGDPYDDGVRLGVGHGVLPDLEGLACIEEDGCFAGLRHHASFQGYLSAR